MSLATWIFTMQAGESQDIPQLANFLGILSTTGKIEVGLDGQPRATLEGGIAFKGLETWERTVIVNSSGSTNTVEIILGVGDYQDNRLSVSTTLTTRDASADVLTTGAAISAPNAATTALAAANPLRKTALIINTGGATVYVGGNAGATAAQGVPVLAGQSLTLDTKAALYARNDSGGALAVSVTELEFSA